MSLQPVSSHQAGALWSHAPQGYALVTEVWLQTWFLVQVLQEGAM